MLSLPSLLSPARPPLTSVRDLKCVADCLLFPTTRCDHVLLHYANYGYQARGIPVALLKSAQETRARIPGRWVTTFHELYASGPPWRSAFWLRPLQVKIARQMISLSSSCIVSNEVIRREILRHDPEKRVRVLPVMSNFGEPAAIDYSRKIPGRWTICGGQPARRRDRSEPFGGCIDRSRRKSLRASWRSSVEARRRGLSKKSGLPKRRFQTSH